jgi:hypothetical protein
MKKILFSLFVIFFGIIFAVFVCFILFTGIQENSQDYVAQRKAIANLEANFENKKNLKNVFQDYELNFQKFQNFFIEQDAPIDFFEFLEDKAEHCSLLIEISSSSVKESKEEKNRYLNLQITLKGDEQNFLRFLEQIENSDYLIEVVSLNLKKANKEKLGIITALLTIKTPVK